MVGDSKIMNKHHLHETMNHGLSMVAEGSNLIMLANMKIAQSIDEGTLKHGMEMMRVSKSLINSSLSGP